MADKKISDLEQISEYNPSAVVPISLFDGYNNVNKKIALTDLNLYLYDASGNIGFPNTVSATTMSATSFTGGSINVTGTSTVGGVEITSSGALSANSISVTSRIAASNLYLRSDDTYSRTEIFNADSTYAFRVASTKTGTDVNNNPALIAKFSGPYESRSMEIYDAYTKIKGKLLIEKKPNTLDFLLEIRDDLSGGNTPTIFSLETSARKHIFWDGSINASGDIIGNYTSDINLKSNINNLTDSLTKVNQLRPVLFNWNDKALELNPNRYTNDVGLIAQEVKEVIPDIVHPMYDGEYLGIDYIKLVPYLIQSIKELSNKINELEDKINIS